MSIRPVRFIPGGMEVIFDETGHEGTIMLADINFTTNIDGTENHNFIVLNCPDGCGASSTHPVGGGAAPYEVQEMFVHKIDIQGCACGEVPARSSRAAADTTAIDHVKELVEAMDGPGRWQHDDAALQARVEALQDVQKATNGKAA